MKIAVALIYKENNILALKKKNNNSHFILPGGKINDKEENFEALIRELKEELQINVSKEQLTYLGKINSISQFENLPLEADVFIVKYEGTFQVANEIESFSWLNIDNIDKTKLARTFNLIVDKYIK
ncbi:NUDIX domain-containing protein [Gemella sp. GH3]|uniref:NUDIX hydrolase n=1 Tax=unclassified Gemella TaxID=2624949 RepID=UPI0015CF8E8F|nr:MULTISPECIES: NUDIX domain-containing protein [unclassified Gemella]MBF0713370.1 NUDIX domain-containing protein [Gemella sp. GH3.1]NYS50322.1 NUDIX domain-containing protein [Gemella sp. GH3]